MRRAIILRGAAAGRGQAHDRARGRRRRRISRGCAVSPLPRSADRDSGREIDVARAAAIEIKGSGERRGGLAPPARSRRLRRDGRRIAAPISASPTPARARAGESIISLSEASSRADRLARALLTGANLELESIQRYRTGRDGERLLRGALSRRRGTSSPFLEPPVRLLLNATTGSLFRLEVDPDWLDPAGPPRARISRRRPSGSRRWCCGVATSRRRSDRGPSSGRWPPPSCSRFTPTTGSVFHADLPSAGAGRLGRSLPGRRRRRPGPPQPVRRRRHGPDSRGSRRPDRPRLAPDESAQRHGIR